MTRRTPAAKSHKDSIEELQLRIDRLSAQIREREDSAGSEDYIAQTEALKTELAGLQSQYRKLTTTPSRASSKKGVSTSGGKKSTLRRLPAPPANKGSASSRLRASFTPTVSGRRDRPEAVAVADSLSPHTPGMTTPQLRESFLGKKKSSLRSRVLPGLPISQIAYHDSEFLFASPVIFLNAKLPDLYEKCKDKGDFERLSVEMAKFCLDCGMELAKLSNYNEESKNFLDPLKPDRQADLVIPFAFFDTKHKLVHSYLIFQRSKTSKYHVKCQIEMLAPSEAFVPKSVLNLLSGGIESSPTPFHPDILIARLSDEEAGVKYGNNNIETSGEMDLICGAAKANPDLEKGEVPTPKFARTKPGGLVDSSPAGEQFHAILAASSSKESTDDSKALSLVESREVSVAEQAIKMAMSELPSLFKRFRLDFFCSEAVHHQLLTPFVDSKEKQAPLFKEGSSGELLSNVKMLIHSRMNSIGKNEEEREEFFQSMARGFDEYPEELQDTIAKEVVEASKYGFVSMLQWCGIRNAGDLQNKVLAEGDDVAFDVSEEAHVHSVIDFLELRIIKKAMERFDPDLHVVFKKTARIGEANKPQIKAMLIKRIFESLANCLNSIDNMPPEDLEFVKNALNCVDEETSVVGFERSLPDKGSNWDVLVQNPADESGKKNGRCFLNFKDMQFDVEGETKPLHVLASENDKVFILKCQDIFNRFLKNEQIAKNPMAAIRTISMLRSLPQDLTETLCYSSWRVGAMADVCIRNREFYRSRWLPYLESVEGQYVDFFRANERDYQKSRSEVVEGYQMLDFGMELDVRHSDPFMEKFLDIYSSGRGREWIIDKTKELFDARLGQFHLVNDGFARDMCIERGRSGLALEDVAVDRSDELSVALFSEFNFEQFYRGCKEVVDEKGGRPEATDALRARINDAFRIIVPVRSLPRLPKRLPRKRDPERHSSGLFKSSPLHEQGARSFRHSKPPPLDLSDARQSLLLKTVQSDAYAMAEDVSKDLSFDMSKWQKYLGQDKGGEELKKAQLAAIELHFQCSGNGSDASNRAQSTCRARLAGVRESVNADTTSVTKDKMLSYANLMDRALATYKEFIDEQGFVGKEKELRYKHLEDLKFDIDYIRASADCMKDASPTVNRSQPKERSPSSIDREDTRRRLADLRRRVSELRVRGVAQNKTLASLRAGPSSPPPDRSTSARSASQLDRGYRENAGSREDGWM